MKTGNSEREREREREREKCHQQAELPLSGRSGSLIRSAVTPGPVARFDHLSPLSFLWSEKSTRGHEWRSGFEQRTKWPAANTESHLSDLVAPDAKRMLPQLLSCRFLRGGPNCREPPTARLPPAGRSPYFISVGGRTAKTWPLWLNT